MRTCIRPSRWTPLQKRAANCRPEYGLSAGGCMAKSLPGPLFSSFRGPLAALSGVPHSEWYTDAGPVTGGPLWVGRCDPSRGSETVIPVPQQALAPPPSARSHTRPRPWVGGAARRAVYRWLICEAAVTSLSSAEGSQLGRQKRARWRLVMRGYFGTAIIRAFTATPRATSCHSNI